ncbi:serine/arginine repetitive matrix protein 4 isoform X2 [Kryptolebias marmoratus]|uniref:serine/arginine repetitive matrix protein 4 isoform X2 n=1 Tax=Kryptolebias marmoratus TaxID=37003 RepID=UPI0007F8D6CD|nr:serine/arginine repetitive matrix protein 4 isoform X2 [Kryptolebias marmoratus]
MQPLQFGHSDPSGSLGSQSTGTSLLKLGEKQLFEKFWKGTFKAVATPRPESVIVASITARRRVPDSETTTCQPLKTDDRKVVDTRADSTNRNGCIKGRKHRRHRRARIHSFDEAFSARPKGKKKKRKSERKRKRKRSPSPSLSPLRKKKKKKKKKSSKKSKRRRYSSKKSKHSSASLKHRRKDERKHKKSSRTRSRRRRRSESHCSFCRSFTEDRRHLQKSAVRQALRDLGETRAELHHTDSKWKRTTKSECKTAKKYRSILSAGTILPSKPGNKLLNGSGSQELSCHAAGPRDYDSGNDTSSPPSSKTGVSRASATENKKNLCQHLASLNEKQKYSYKDNGSDSGNSVTSYASSCKPYKEDSLPAIVFRRNGKSEQITLGCQVEVVRSSKRSRSSRRRLKSHSSSSRSRSSESFRYSERHSRSPSLYSCSSSDMRRRGSLVSLSSRGSYSRYSVDRLRDRKRPSSSREADVKRKVSGKRRRRKSYSPMKKRRRDSPSHLEARRITSARKRPIPYFRPSPSSSSRSTSVSSWSSLFTRSHSRSRSRSHSYSSYRSYSRSSSWNSIFGSHSRSRSRSSLRKRKKARQ